MSTRAAKINFSAIAKVMGWLLLIEALFMVAPLITSFYYHEDTTAKAFLVSFIATLCSGFILTSFLKQRASSAALTSRDSMLLTASVWIVFSLFGLIPFILSGAITNFIDAFFETMSGFTTTGATIVEDVESLPHGILMWRAVMQWIGGLGIIIFTLAVIPMLNYQSGIQMFQAEATGIMYDRLRPRISQTAKSLWMVYIVLSIALFLLLWAGPMDAFDSICHTLATVSTGGFSTKNESIGHWNSFYIDIVIAVFMFLGGINFALLFKFSRGDYHSALKNDTFKWYATITLCASIIIIARMIYMDFCDSWAERFVFAFFDTISITTSTAFSVAHYEDWGEFVAMVLFCLMFFGASAGSTSGGAKIDRLMVLLKNCKNEFYHVLHPNSVTPIRINGDAISKEITYKVIAFLLIYLITILAIAMILSLFGFPIFDSIFTSISMMSNVGVGYGITGTAGSFAFLPGICKIILALEMMIGRLEIFTVIILFTRGFWRK